MEEETIEDTRILIEGDGIAFYEEDDQPLGLKKQIWEGALNVCGVKRNCRLEWTYLRN